MTEHGCRACGHHVNQHTIPGISTGCVTGCSCELTREEVLDAMLAAARAEGARDMRTKIETPADDFDTNIDWSNGRHDYGDNAAWESAARQLRALLADGGEPQ